MNSLRTRTSLSMHFICFFIAIFLLNFSCSKDSDTLRKQTTNEEIISLIEQDSTENNTSTDEEEETNEPKEDSEEDRSTPKECVTNGGKANETGLKTWCWEDIDLPSGAPRNNSFSDGQLGVASECNPNLVTQQGNQLRFDLNPTVPAAQSWCRNDYNMRAEISTNPWQVNHPLGTEEWMGWSYTFADDYVVDSYNPWGFFQMQQGIAGSPPVHIVVHPVGYYGAQNGEIVISNLANKTEDHDRTLTGVVPRAGTTLNIVVHVIHDLGSKGLLQVWINGQKVYDKQVGTVHDWAPWGGNAKFGIYKWPWKDEGNIQNSIDEGSNELTTYMGPLRILTRKLGDANYGENSYELVAPE